MILALSNRLADFMINKEIIEKDSKCVYIYGLELLISSWINFLLVMLIGTLFGRIFHTIIFCVIYYPLKSICGGYHAGSYKKCIGIFSVCYILLNILYSGFEISQVGPIHISLFIVAAVIIVCLAPVEDLNKPLTMADKKRLGKKARVLTIFYVTTILLICILGQYIWRQYILFAVTALIWVGWFLGLGYIKNCYIIRRKSNVENSCM